MQNNQTNIKQIFIEKMKLLNSFILLWGFWALNYPNLLLNINYTLVVFSLQATG